MAAAGKTYRRLRRQVRASLRRVSGRRVAAHSDGYATGVIPLLRARDTLLTEAAPGTPFLPERAPSSAAKTDSSRCRVCNQLSPEGVLVAPQCDG